MRGLTRRRVAILADYREEGWASMDLVADRLWEELGRSHTADVDVTVIRPALPRRLRRVLPTGRAATLDRVMGRLWDYPRLARGLPSFDVYHVIDHSYSHLVHALPAERTVVTCHDVDTFRSVTDAASEPRSAAFRAMTRRILSGLRGARFVACVSEATRQLVVSLGVDRSRTAVVHNGVEPCFSPFPDYEADAAAAEWLGERGARIDLLHVGTTIPRKRIPDLLRTVAEVRKGVADVRLVRVGGALTAEQQALAEQLGVEVVVVPFVTRSVLAAIYRRSALLLLPSEREGFGLPLAEGLACGLPAVVSDIEALREVGAAAATYCPVGMVDAWVSSVESLLAERSGNQSEWRVRQAAARERGAAFTWGSHAKQIVEIYRAVALGDPVSC